MKSTRVGANLPLLAAVATSLTRAFVYDIQFSKERFLAADAPDACKALGYDGLGIINAPEAFGQALQISKWFRHTVIGGFYMGLTTDTDDGILSWPDGSLPAKDLPWAPGQPARNQAGQGNGIVMVRGKMKMGKGLNLKYVLCGNHDEHRSSETFGSTFHGKKPRDRSPELTAPVATRSYLECVMLCGMEALCRVAEFNSDLSLCTLLGPSKASSVTLIDSPASTTFVRVGFKDYL